MLSVDLYYLVDKIVFFLQLKKGHLSLATLCSGMRFQVMVKKKVSAAFLVVLVLKRLRSLLDSVVLNIKKYRKWFSSP